MLAIVIILFFVLLFIGCPVAMAMGIGVMPYFIFTPKVKGLVIAQKMFTAADSFSLTAIVFFMLAGCIMEEAGITSDMVDWANALVGHFKGGLAQTATVAGVILAGVSGSANADAAALGAILVPSMVKAGYDEGFSCVTVACAGGLGPIIPPSITMVIYASCTGFSTGTLFTAGIIPGLILAALYMGYNYYYAKSHNVPNIPFKGWKHLLTVTKKSIGAIIMPVLIVGGLLFGIFTATEAGVVACVYGIIYGFASRKLNFKQFVTSLTNSAVSAAGPMFIIMMSSALSYSFTRLGMSDAIADFCKNSLGSAGAFFAFVIVINLISGCFIDGNAWILMVVPILYPMLQVFGISELQFGMVFLLTLFIGGITPPVGMYLMITCGVMNTSLGKTLKYIIPFLTIQLVNAILICIFPQIVEFLPNLMASIGA